MERPCAWKKYTPQQIEELEELCRGYKQFLSENKTERLCVKAGIKMAEEAGYVNLETVIAEGRALKAGDKVYAANHGKESLAMDLKDPEQRGRLEELLRRADAVLFNYRPGVAERLGLDYDSVRRINPEIIYGSITGYGAEGPWSTRPGQDLLVQSLSGICWLNGNQSQPPLPMSVGITDIMASSAASTTAVSTVRACAWMSACWSPRWTSSSRALPRSSTTMSCRCAAASTTPTPMWPRPTVFTAPRTATWLWP